MQKKYFIGILWNIGDVKKIVQSIFFYLRDTQIYFNNRQLYEDTILDNWINIG